MRKIDIVVICGVLLLLAILFMAPPESRTPVPNDDTHQQSIRVNHDQGKKAAEKICRSCHNESGVPFPEKHPHKPRCLFCHKVAPPQQKHTPNVKSSEPTREKQTKASS